jgi:hypothetical protein
MIRAVAFTSLVMALASPTHAQEPAALVRGYFAALEKKDFDQAIRLTAGSAQSRTQHMVGTLQQEAAQHHAEVEVKVQKLDVSPCNDGQRVKVAFNIDIIGKKWVFRKVARTLCGTAEFKVANSGDHIERIDGNLE